VSEKLSNAPVYYALAQAQFNPVAAMGRYVDEIQDRLRRQGYTLFEPLQTPQLQFTDPAGKPMSEPVVVPMISWLITKEDRSSGFILGTSSIAFHTTHYETRHEFISALMLGLKNVHEVVQLDHISRLGLRYLDAVLPLPDETVNQYLVNGLHGLQVNAKLRYSRSESVFDTETGPLLPNGTLIIRIHQSYALLGYPPDMIPNGLQPMQKFNMLEPKDHAIIDTDHFVLGTMPLDFEQIKDQSMTLHATIKKVLFEDTITEHAKKIWA